jgi:hypothetical protein
MAAPLIPWEPCNIPEELQAELSRRKVNRSLNYIDAAEGNWDDNTGDWSKYKGPMVPWIRCCSNGKGRESGPDAGKEGFVFYGGKSFYTGYGFNTHRDDPSIIGYMPNRQNTPHIISNDMTADYPIHVPPPEIEKLSATIQKEHFRRVTLEWVCFSKRQLEYMTPYFLVPGISCIIEWGWNHFDHTSLLNLSDDNTLKDIFHNPYPLYTDNILKSKGNYDAIFGIVTHFEWSIDGNKIKCKTEVTSKDRIYSGLIIDSNSTDTGGETGDVKPLGKLTEFIDKSLTQFKAIKGDGDLKSVPQLAEFLTYVAEYHPKDKWKEYIYGIFYGRNPEDSTNPFRLEANTDRDFDYVNGKNAELWLNFGLVIEAINFHSAPLTGMQKKEMFRVDIDDCVIGAHPNMISSDGRICLIPNAIAPKYHCGNYGPDFTKSTNYNPEDWSKLIPSTEAPGVNLKYDAAEKAGMLYDYRLRKVCLQSAPTRDNLDEIINWIRYSVIGGKTSFAFPFRHGVGSVGDKPYPARYSGHIKDIYVNVTFLTDLLKRSDEIKTYPKFIEKILEGINSACGNFWDLRLVDSTGNSKLKKSEIATMKIVDYKFMYFANRGKVWTFDYMDSDSLLLGMSFKPTLSNAAAIRTMFAGTNNPDKRTIITNGSNELLDYHFRDRLLLAEDIKGEAPKKSRDSESYKDTMRTLQQIKPVDGSYQITNKQDNKIIIRRMVLPDPEIVQMLLDDTDEKNNPKYTGIMPNIQASFTIQGIGGIRTFMMFLVRNLPEPYSHKNIVFRVVDVQEAIEAGKWTTTIVAGIIPLRDYIKARLSIAN